MTPEFLITLVEKTRQIRFPRSKKRRIRRKWRKNPSNWGDDLRVFESIYIGGKLSMLPPPEEMPRYLTMHPKAWERMQANNPTLAARCDVLSLTTYEWFTPQSHSS